MRCPLGRIESETTLVPAMIHNETETIFALSSGGARAGVAVVRVSGTAAGGALRALTGTALPTPRLATRARLVDPSGEPIDTALVLWFPAPRSFTGEDVVEFHVHGGRAVVGALVATLAALPGLRPAAAGEFTRRAFDHGKLDLTQAEGLADLIDAETEAQRRQALRQLDGELGALCEGWREALVSALAHAEAAIDFPDEDLPEGVVEGMRSSTADIHRSIARYLDDERRGERLREGLYVAIVGAPNVGKSSLLNRLARREAAIVSARAGTTRDVVEVHLDVAGLPAILADTAGLRASADAVESEGVRRALDRAARADLKVAVFDATATGGADEGRTRDLVDENTLVVFNKTDVCPPSSGLKINGCPAIPVSARTGAGVDALVSALERAAADRVGLGAAPAITRARHRTALESCRDALARFGDGGAPELAAEDLRLAARALGRITGRVDVEDILDVVFKDFCIGK